MKRVVFIVICILLFLTSCNLTPMDEERGVNDYIFPYIEFTLSEDGTYYTASVVEGAQVSEVYIASYVDDFSISIPVKYFNGFQNPEDEVNIEKVVFESNVTELGPEILESNTNKYTIEYASTPVYKTWENLPTLPNKREGEFKGWISNITGEFVKNGDLITSDNASISPFWASHGDLKHYDAKAPTCTEIGWNEYYECSTCGWTDYVELERISHEPVYHEEVEATCTSSGTRAYYECQYCHSYFSDSVCSAEIDQIVTPALGHATVYIEEKEATCTESGLQAHYECARCHKLFSDENATKEIEESSLLTSALGHNWVRKQFSETASCTWDECTRCGETQDSVGHTWDDGVVTTSPTKTDHGIKTFTCTVCESTKTEDIAPLGEHTWVDSDPVAPTCTKRGYTTRTCSECEISYNYEYIDAVGHVMKEIAAKDATCTENGNSRYYVCSVCGNLYKDKNGINGTTLSEVQEGKKATGHKYSENVFEKNENYHWHECYVCGIEIEGSKTKHSYTQEKTVYQAEKADCTHPAKYYYTCVCGEKGTETFEYGEPDGHKGVYHEKKEADCGNDGSIEYWECSVCKKKFYDEKCSREINGGNEIIKATGNHTFESYVSFGKDGHKKHCSVCNKEYGDYLSHNIDTLNWEDNSTHHWHECGGCGYKIDYGEHTYEKYGTDEICNVCKHLKAEKEDTADGGFDINPETLEPKGKLIVEGSDGSFTATFTLDENSAMTSIVWYLENVEMDGETKERSSTCSFSAPERHTYHIMCVVFNKTLVSSFEQTVIGGETT